MSQCFNDFRQALSKGTDFQFLQQHCKGEVAIALGTELIAFVQNAPTHNRIYHSSTELIASAISAPHEQYAFLMRMSNLAPRCQRTYYFMALQEVCRPEIATLLMSDLKAIWDRYRLNPDLCDTDCTFCEGSFEYADCGFFCCLASCIATVSTQPLDTRPLDTTEIGRAILCIMLADSLNVSHDGRSLLTWERFPPSLAIQLQQDALGIAQRAADTALAQHYPYIKALANKLLDYLEEQ